MLLIIILLLLASAGVDGENTGCDICVIDYSCDDDAVYFNLSISKHCESPLGIYYNYDTEIHSGKRFMNATVDCDDCYFDLAVDVERDAWDYTLTILSPKSTALCSEYTAVCGGKDSRVIWYITGGLSGLFAILGAAACVARCFRTNPKKKTILKINEKSAINV